MILGQGVLDQRPIKKRPTDLSRSVSLTPSQRDCIAKFESCAQDLGITKSLIGKWGNFKPEGVTPMRPPGPVTQERVDFAIGKLRQAYQAPRPHFTGLGAACDIAFRAIQAKHSWKSTIRRVLIEIQDNEWWWTKIRTSQHLHGSRVLRELTDCGVFQAYGKGRGRLHRIGPKLARNPEICQDLLIAPPTDEDIVNQIQSLDLEGMIEPSIEKAVPSDRVLEPLPSVEDRIDLHLSQVNDLLRNNDLTASVTIELRKLKRSLLKTQLQVFKP